MISLTSRMLSHKRSNTLTFGVATLLLALLAAGCNPRSIVEPIVYAGRGGISPSTESEMFRINIDGYIRRELVGEKFQFRPDMTWKTFWRLRYESIRELKDPVQVEQDIAYIHQQRQRFGLPLYDDRS